MPARTLEQRARRQANVTNVASGLTTEKQTEKEEIKEIKRKPHDQVSGKKLQDKVRYQEGKDKIGNSENNPMHGNDEEKEEIKEIKHKPAKDGTMRGGKREGAGRKPKKPSQKIAWRNAEKKLAQVAKYMMDDCEVPAELQQDIADKINRHIEILITFKNEIGIK